MNEINLDVIEIDPKPITIKNEYEFLDIELSIDNRNSVVEVPMDRFKELLINHGWWWKNRVGNEPQAYSTYVKTFDKYDEKITDVVGLSEILGQLQNIVIDGRYVTPNSINYPWTYPHLNEEIIKLLKKLEKLK